ncbi:MAG TPA: hypothetical protein VFQ99_05805, partial [Gallionella sp.]|nr:hypothetical protein [Gallionella sp.]
GAILQPQPPPCDNWVNLISGTYYSSIYVKTFAEVVEADAVQGARNTATEAYRIDRRRSEYRATRQCAAADTYCKGF